MKPGDVLRLRATVEEVVDLGPHSNVKLVAGEASVWIQETALENMIEEAELAEPAAPSPAPVEQNPSINARRKTVEFRAEQPGAVEQPNNSPANSEAGAEDVDGDAAGVGDSGVDGESGRGAAGEGQANTAGAAGSDVPGAEASAN